jgi:chlorite dismutase
MMKPSEKSESEEYMMGDAYRVAKQAYDKEDKTMTTRDAGLTQEQVEAAEVHAAGSSHCGEIRRKSAFSRYSTALDQQQQRRGGAPCLALPGPWRRPLY